MQVSELPAMLAEPIQPQAALPDTPNDDLETAPSFIDPLELEALALILEHSLKVHTPHHFFCWTQGLLQNLVPHQLLICAMRRIESPAYILDCYSSTAVEPSQISNLFNQDTGLVPHLLKIWEAQRFQPAICELAAERASADSALGRELLHQGVGQVLVHGTYDTSGRPASIFFFCSPPGTLAARQAHLAALLVPSLHAAWMHCQFSRPAAGSGLPGQAGQSEILTAREQEILGWIYRGKSNIEIGMILGISSLTVKNHVQKILRRLNVINRAQAVGKALALRILDGTLQRSVPRPGQELR